MQKRTAGTTAYATRLNLVGRLSITVIIMAMMNMSIFIQVYAADIPKTDQIRAALFISSEKYTAAAPAVTLSAENGIILGNRTSSSSGVNEWFAVPADSVRVSIDQFRIQWSHAVDYTRAKELYDRLAALNQSASIYRSDIENKISYDVYSGPYPSAEAARNAMTKLLQDNHTLAVVLSDAQVRGPHRWSAGNYTSETEAVQQQTVLRNHGVAADIAYIMDPDGNISYSVWIGHEASPEQLASFQQTVLKKLPNLNLQSVESSTPYLLKKEDASQGAQDAQIHYWIHRDGQTLTAAPAASGNTITVKERSGRSYRGILEVSQYRGQLALINEVDLEQYLYSVVSVEMGKGWPYEALKAQAIAARTFALVQGMKYGIAHISDSTFDQAYYGAAVEDPEIVKAVNETRGLVIVNDQGLITPFYSSNAGGTTAAPEEVYGNPVPYLKSVISPDERVASASSQPWHYIMLADGTKGYITSQFIRTTGEQDESGYPYYEPTGTNVNVRRSPNVNNLANPPITQVNPGDRFISLGQTAEESSSPNSWERGPYTSEQLLEMINKNISEPIAGPLISLEVTKRGPSGRATEIKANGQTIKVAYPDAFRGMFGGLPSTLFEIEQSGMYTILGAEQYGRSQKAGASLHILTGTNATILPPATLFIIDGLGKVTSAAISESSGGGFVFRGSGSGHGLGLSQWGARGLAEQGADYEQILRHYYVGIQIVKMGS